MNKKEALSMFTGSVAFGTSVSPDEYPSWNPDGYAAHRADLVENWRIAREGIKRDLDRVAKIDVLLEQALASFDRGEREPGRSLMCDIYNLLRIPDKIR